MAQSGTVTPAGDLSLADGATLKFTFTERSQAPVLNLTGKTVTLGDQIKVSLSGEHPAYGTGKYTLTSGGGFDGVTIAKADDCASWVSGFDIDESGNVYAMVKATGFMLMVK